MSADGLVQTHIRRQSMYMIGSQVELKVYEAIGSIGSVNVYFSYFHLGYFDFLIYFSLHVYNECFGNC